MFFQIYSLMAVGANRPPMLTNGAPQALTSRLSTRVLDQYPQEWRSASYVSVQLWMPSSDFDSSFSQTEAPADKGREVITHMRTVVVDAGLDSRASEATRAAIKNAQEAKLKNQFEKAKQQPPPKL